MNICSGLRTNPRIGSMGGQQGLEGLWMSGSGACTKGHPKPGHPLGGFCSRSCPGQSGNGSSVGAACNPTWGRGHRSLVAQAVFKQRLAAIKPHIVVTRFGCTPWTSPAQMAHCLRKALPRTIQPQVHRIHVSRNKTFLQITPSHQAMLKLLKNCQGSSSFFFF